MKTRHISLVHTSVAHVNPHYGSICEQPDEECLANQKIMSVLELLQAMLWMLIPFQLPHQTRM